MSLTIGTLVGYLEVDDRKMTAGIDNAVGNAEKRFGGLGGVVKKAAGVMAGALAATAAVDFLGGAINSASDLAETVSKARTIFGPAADDLESWASKAATSLGQSKQQALDAAASFGNLFVQIGIGSDQAADMSKSMVGLASDFASFHNADITEVLNAQQAAFRGEYDALQRFVPTINAATVEQAALAATGKKTTAELTAQEKALAVQALMLKGAGDAAGDFSRTSDSLANKQRVAAAQWENMKATIGSGLIPVTTALVSVISDTLIPAVGSLTGFLRDALAKMEEWAPVMAPIAALIASVFVPAMLAAGAAAVASAAKQVAAWATSVAASVAATATHSAQVVRQVAAWALLGAQSLLHAAKVAAAWMIAIGPVALVGAAVVGLVALVVKNWDTIERATRTAFNAIKDFLARWWPIVVGIATGGIGLIVGLIVKNWEAIRTRTTEAFSALKTTVSSALSEVVAFFTALPGRILAQLNQLPGQLVTMGRNLISGFVEGVSAMAGALLEKVRSVITAPIDWAKDFLGIASPSKLFFGFGQNTIKGYVRGLEDQEATLHEKIQSMFQSAVSGVNTILGGIGSLGANHDARTGVDEAARELWDLAQRQTALPGEIAAAEQKLRDARAKAARITLEEESAILDARQRLADAEERLVEAEAAGLLTADQRRRMQLDIALAEKELNKTRREAVAKTGPAIEEAEERLKELREEHLEIGAKVLTAERALNQAKLDAIAAEARLIQSGQEILHLGAESHELFRQIAERIGLSAEEVANLAAQYSGLAQAIEAANRAAEGSATARAGRAVRQSVPRLHSGGIFRAPTPGGEGLALLRDREVVLTPEQQVPQRGGAGDMHIHLTTVHRERLNVKDEIRRLSMLRPRLSIH